MTAKAISHFQADHILTRFVFPPLLSQRLIAWVCCLCAIGTAAKAYANNDPTFTVSAPENIEINKQFRLTFIVSFPEKPATVEIQNLAVPELKGFKVLLGPTKSSATNVEKVDGEINRKYQESYTYVLQALQVGRCSIPSASIVVNGHQLHSQQLAVNVVPDGKLPPSSDPQPKPDVFMTMNVSERSPRINEPVVLECKLYTTSLADSLANMEQLISSDDFKIEPIDLRGSAWQIEHRNGKNYQVAVFRKLLLYPLRAGELRIGDLYMDVYIRRYNLSSDPFEAFFEDGNHQFVKQRVNCQGITLHAHE